MGTPAQNPSLPQDPELALLPKRPQAKTMPRSSPFPYLSFSWSCSRSPSSLECALVGFRVASSCSHSLLQDLRCAGLSLNVAVYKTMCHATRDHGVSDGRAQGGKHPCMGPCLREWVPVHAGSKPLVGPISSGPASTPMVESGATGPKQPNAKSPEGESFHQAPKSPHIKRVNSLYQALEMRESK